MKRVASSSGLDLAACPRAVTASPPFNVGTLRKAIPAHCFERSLLWSLFYLFADLSCIVSLGCGSQLIDHPSIPRWLAWSCLWPLYWFLQVSTFDTYCVALIGATAR